MDRYSVHLLLHSQLPCVPAFFLFAVPWQLWSVNPGRETICRTEAVSHAWTKLDPSELESKTRWKKTKIPTWINSFFF